MNNQRYLDTERAFWSTCGADPLEHWLGRDNGDPRDLGDIKARIRMIWGENEVLADAALPKQMIQALPTADMVEIPDAGHVPWLADADRVADAVRSFHGQA